MKTHSYKLILLGLIFLVVVSIDIMMLSRMTHTTTVNNHPQAIALAEALIDIANENQSSSPPEPAYRVASWIPSSQSSWMHLVLPRHPYFCGSGGCTALIYDHEGVLLQKITVVNPPIYCYKHRTLETRTELAHAEHEPTRV